MMSMPAITPDESRAHRDPPDPDAPAEIATMRGMTAALRQAVDEGTLTPAQAMRVAELAGGPATLETVARGRRRGLVAEAIGYLGATLALVAAMVIAQQFWGDLTSWAQTGLLAVVTVGLLGAGFVATGEVGTAGGRLGSFLWLAAVAALAGTVTVIVVEIVGVREEQGVLIISAAAAVLALVLWLQRPRVMQLVALFVPVVALASSALAAIDLGLAEFVGFMLWAVGVAWLLLGWGGVLRPARPAYALGAVLALFGPFLEAHGRWELLLGLATAAALMGAGVVLQRTVLLGIGVAGVFLYVPRTVFAYFGETLGAPVALLLIGVVLVGTALGMSRRWSA